MKTNNIKILSLFILAGLLIGVSIGHTSIFGIMKLAGITGLFILIYIVCKITETIIKKKMVFATFIGLSSMAVVIALIASVTTLKIVASHKKNLAEELIVKIENYEKLNAEYPKTIDELKFHSKSYYFDELEYTTDATRQYFRIGYSMNGLDFCAYDSNHKKWITTGD